MKRRVLFPIALLVLGLAGAFAQDVRYNFDKATDFSKFKTYKWVDLKNSTDVNSMTDKQIKESIDAELAKKGLTKTDADQADLYVGYQAAVNQQQEFTSYSTGWGYGPGWGGGYYGGPTSTTTTGQTSTIYQGQLALDMYDPANKDLVWRGIVSKTLDPKAKPDKQEKNLDKAVAKLLKNFPPEKKEEKKD